MVISNVPEWNYILSVLAHPDVSEVEANGPDSIFIKAKGVRKRLEKINFKNDEEYSESIAHGLSPLVNSTDGFGYDKFLYEGRLAYLNNGEEIIARCHIVLPPATNKPQVTIAKKTASLKTLDGIAAAGSMSTEMLNFLKACVKSRMCIVMSGSTGSGKTTMLEAMTKIVDNNTRIGVAEDSPELILQQQNVSYLNSVPWRPGMSENDVATLDWVVQQFQRMRTDMVIIGETRGKEFYNFIIAANSGMDGSMTTIHANDARMCLNKMTSFALRGAERQPIKSINRDIASAVQIIVQLKIVDGKHRVTQIEEVTNQVGNTEDAQISTNRLYSWNIKNDSFYKDGPFSDEMREKFKSYNVDVSDFLSSPVGENNSVPAHKDTSIASILNSSNNHDVRNNMGMGIPINPLGGR